jgi:outer membrane beta-barrel protein
MNRSLPSLLAAVPIALASAGALAQATTPAPSTQPSNEQVVVPQVERRDVKLPRYPSKDIEVGAFLGVYSTENFGASAVYGLRLGYHITEDFFVQANLAQTKVSDENFRQLLPGGGIFPTPSEKLTYYNLTAGWNVLPGEVFIGAGRAKATSVYLLAGIGSTKLAERRNSTFNFGVGLRGLLADRAAVHLELRDHVFSTDLLGPRTSTHNLELSTGFSWFF